MVAFVLLILAARAEPVLQPQVGHAAPPRTLAISPDGERLLTLSSDETARLWALDSGHELRSFAVKGVRGPAAGFTADGRLRIADEESVRTYDPRTGALLATFDPPLALGMAALDGDASTVAWHALDGDKWQFWLADVDSAAIRGPFPSLPADERSFSPDGALYAWEELHTTLFDGFPGAIHVVDVATGAEVRTIVGMDPLWAPSGALWSRRADARTEVHDLAGESPAIAEIYGRPLAVSEDGAWACLGLDRGMVDKPEILLVRLSDAGAAHFPEGSACALPGGNTMLLATADGISRFNLDAWNGVWATKTMRATRSGLAWSPDGTRLATSAGGAVELWDLQALRLLTAGPPGPRIFHLSWGERLSAWSIGEEADARLTTVDGRTAEQVDAIAVVDPAIAGNAVGDGLVYASMADHTVRMRAADGAERTIGRVPRKGDRWDAHVSDVQATPDGRWVVALDESSSSQVPDRLLLFDADKPRGKPVTADVEARWPWFAMSPDGRRVAVAGSGVVEILEVPSLDRVRRIAVTEGDARAVALSPDGSQVAVTADDRALTLWDVASGAELARTTTPDIARAVAFSPDGRLVAATAGPVQLWDPASGALLWLQADPAGRWLAYTPDGLFDGSRDSADLVAVVDGFDVYSVDQFALRNNRPDQILERMGLGDPEVVAHFRAQVARRQRLTGVSGTPGLDLHAPTVTIAESKPDGRAVVLTFDVADDRDPLVRYTVFVNGVPVDGKPIGGPGRITSRVDLLPGSSRVEVSVTDAAGTESRRATVFAHWDGEAPSRLFFAGFGVSDYRDSSLDLRFAHQDALDLAALLGRADGFTEVTAKTWTDTAATRDSLREGAEFLAKAGPDDLVVVFVAGHGLHDADAARTYYFLPHDADLARLSDTAVPYEALEQLVSGTAARRRLVLLDTCESGDDDLSAGGPTLGGLGRGVRTAGVRQRGWPPPPWMLDRERWLYADLVRRSGAIVFSSSRGGEVSYEDETIANGYFTEELLAVLGSSAGDLDGDGVITTDELRREVARRVAVRSGDRQHPTVDRDNPWLRFGFTPIQAP